MGEEVEFRAPWRGPADWGAPPALRSKPFTPCFSLLFPPPQAKLTAPSPSRLRLQKCTIGRRRGRGWGAWTGWGSPWKGLDGAREAPLVSASSVYGPGARTTVPRTEVARGGWGGCGGVGRRRGRGKEGGREGAGKERGGELRGSPVSAHAPGWRAALGRELDPRRDVQLWQAVGERGPRPAGRCWARTTPSPDWAYLPGAPECRRGKGGVGSGRGVLRASPETQCHSLGFQTGLGSSDSKVQAET